MAHLIKLKEFRAKHGKMKQSDLAKLFGIGQTDVSRMELGHKPLTDEQYQILVDNYGIDAVDKFLVREIGTELDNWVRKLSETKTSEKKTTIYDLVEYLCQENVRLQKKIIEMQAERAKRSLDEFLQLKTAIKELLK